MNWFAALIEDRLETPRDVAPIARELKEACVWVLDHYDGYEIVEHIYGDLRARYEKLIANIAPYIYASASR